ncbi:MAG: Carbon monoxide oxidation accessory protein CoxE, partial [uncultured Rubrobacteraceae bacterium]
APDGGRLRASAAEGRARGGPGPGGRFRHGPGGARRGQPRRRVLGRPGDAVLPPGGLRGVREGLQGVLGGKGGPQGPRPAGEHVLDPSLPGLRAAAQEERRERREGRRGREAPLQPRGRAAAKGLRRLHARGVRGALQANGGHAPLGGHEALAAPRARPQGPPRPEKDPAGRDAHRRGADASSLPQGQGPAPPGRAPLRRLGLDGLLQPGAPQVHARGRGLGRAGRGLRNGDPAHARHPRACDPQPGPGAAGGFKGDRGLVRGDPARGHGKRVRGRVGPARDGPGCRRGPALRRLGPRGRGGARGRDAAHPPPRPQRHLGEPPEGRPRLPAARPRDGRGAPLRRRFSLRPQLREPARAGLRRRRGLRAGSGWRAL